MNNTHTKKLNSLIIKLKSYFNINDNWMESLASLHTSNLSIYQSLFGDETKEKREEADLRQSLIQAEKFLDLFKENLTMEVNGNQLLLSQCFKRLKPNDLFPSTLNINKFEGPLYLINLLLKYATKGKSELFLEYRVILEKNIKELNTPDSSQSFKLNYADSVRTNILTFFGYVDPYYNHSIRGHSMFSLANFLISSGRQDLVISNCLKLCEESLGYIDFYIHENTNKVLPPPAVQETDHIQEHLEKARTLHSLQDYPNSIKESICAMEALFKELSRNNGAGLSDVSQKVTANLGIHHLIGKSILDLYNYTSSAGGVRHSNKPGEIKLDLENESLLINETCQSFIKYYRSKSKSKK